MNPVDAFLVPVFVLVLVAGLVTGLLHILDFFFGRLMRKHYARRQQIFVLSRILQALMLLLMTLTMIAVCYYGEHK